MRYFVRSIARASAVLQNLASNSVSPTLSGLAFATGMSKSTVRRFLLTLRDLGYVETIDGRYRLTPKVLEMGFAFLNSLDFPQRAQPLLEHLSERVGESTSMALLDGLDIVYVARVAVKRIMSINLYLGSRLPAHCTSMGKVLLADLPEDEVRRRYEGIPLSAFTPKTVVDLEALLLHLADVRAKGYALNDEELELGLRSVAAPVYDISGKAVAAVNVSTPVARVPSERLCGEFTPLLLQTAQAISEALGFQGRLRGL